MKVLDEKDITKALKIHSKLYPSIRLSTVLECVGEGMSKKQIVMEQKRYEDNINSRVNEGVSN